MQKNLHQTIAPLFQLGVVVATQAVNEHFELHQLDPCNVLARHVTGDWGDLPIEDVLENDFALERPLRIFSTYEVAGKAVWVITEGDREATTLMFPHEY